jgi:hypothetical protein
MRTNHERLFLRRRLASGNMLYLLPDTMRMDDIDLLDERPRR